LPRKSDTSLVGTGFILCFIGALIAVLVGILELINAIPSVNLNGLVVGIIYLALGLLSLQFSVQVRRHYNPTKGLLLLLFAVLFLIMWYWGTLGIYAILVGVLMLIGVLLMIVGKG
jgi:hypothetical protein